MNEFIGFCVPIPKTDGQGVTTMAGTGQTFVVLAYAEWCGACMEAKPNVQQASCGFPDLPFYRLDADGDLGPINVEVLPTVVLFKGGQEAGRIEGAYSASDYIEKINILLAGGTLPQEPEYDDEGEDDEEPA